MEPVGGLLRGVESVEDTRWDGKQLGTGSGLPKVSLEIVSSPGMVLPLNTDSSYRLMKRLIKAVDPEVAVLVNK